MPQFRMRADETCVPHPQLGEVTGGAVLEMTVEVHLPSHVDFPGDGQLTETFNTIRVVSLRYRFAHHSRNARINTVPDISAHHSRNARINTVPDRQ